MRRMIAFTLFTTTVLSGCAGINETNKKFADVDARLNAIQQTHATDASAIDAKINALAAKHDADLAALATKHDTDISKLEKNIQEALERANAAHQLAEGKFVYSKVLNGDAINFSSGKAELPPATQEYLKNLAQTLMSENKNVYLEIQGHTDGTGANDINVSLGLKRADTVRAFLNQQGIALNRMSTISYGQVVPLDTNKTAKGRAANRRVEIIVLK